MGRVSPRPIPAALRPEGAGSLVPPLPGPPAWIDRCARLGLRDGRKSTKTGSARWSGPDRLTHSRRIPEVGRPTSPARPGRAFFYLTYGTRGEIALIEVDDGAALVRIPATNDPVAGLNRGI